MKKVLFGMALLVASTFSCTQKPQQAANNETAPADSTLRINCMIEVTPQVRDSVIALSKELVDSSKNDAGNICYDIMESSTDSNSLMIFETWESQTALDKHSASAHFTRIVPQIQKLATMDVQVLSKAVAQSDAQPTDSVIRLNCIDKVSAENKVEVVSLVKELVECSKKDEGVIDYDLFQSLTDPTFLLIFETWETQDALDKHSAADHFTRIVPIINKKFESSTIDKYMMPKK